MGAKNFTLSDLGNEVSISGANSTGKTRLFNAFTWLFYGTDCENRSDFNIKALNENNEPLHRADHSVSAVLVIDGIEQKFERILREKWVKKRGEENQEFDGNETLYKINDVPHKAKEYQEKIDAILPENIFKLLTNPFYFNSSMKWTERREILFKVAGDIKDGEIIEAYPELKGFLNFLNGKSLEDFKKEMAAKKKLLKDELSGIPARMDEVNRAILPDPDYPAIESQIQDLNKQIADIDSLMSSTAKKYDKKNQENQTKQNRIYELQQKIRELQYNDRGNAEKTVNDLKLKRNELQSEIRLQEQNITSLQNIIRTEENGIKSLTEENDRLRKDWTKINEEIISIVDDEFICPTCKRQFETDDIEARKAEMTSNFNTDKAARLARISEKGTGNKAEIDRLRIEILRVKKSVEIADAVITKNRKELEKIVIPEAVAIQSNPQIKVLQDQITEIEKTIELLKKADNSELINKKLAYVTELDFLKKQLTIKEENEKRQVRLAELEDQQKSLSQQIASLEKQEFQCEKFIRAKVSMVEEKINGLFSFVQFKLFDQLINGGLEETCICLLKGVPFPDVNGAGKIQAGLDIIRTLSNYYNCHAPTWIDNRESCTEIPEMDCQVISLIVDPSYKELKVITKN